MSLYPLNISVEKLNRHHDSAPRSVRRKVILFMVVALAALILAGLFPLSQRAEAETQSKDDGSSLMSVEVVEIRRNASYDFLQHYTGRIEAAQTIQMAFEQGGKVQSMIVEEGDKVSKDDVLAQLETRSLKANLREQLALRKANEAAVKRNRSDLSRQNQLESSGFSADQAVVNARLNLAQARAILEQADARIQSLDIALQKANLKAPFSGIIGERLTDAGAIVKPGESIFTLFDNATMVVKVGLPPARANSLVIGDKATFVLGQSTFVGVYMGARPDISQRTRTLETRFEVSNPPPFLAYGQLVTMALKQAITEDGYWVPISALTEGERGLWSLLTVQDELAGSEGDSVDYSDRVQRISRQHVEILESNGTSAYVKSDIGEAVRVVTKGGHRLVPGQRVQIVPASR